MSIICQAPTRQGVEEGVGGAALGSGYTTRVVKTYIYIYIFVENQRLLIEKHCLLSQEVERRHERDPLKTWGQHDVFNPRILRLDTITHKPGYTTHKHSQPTPPPPPLPRSYRQAATPLRCRRSTLSLASRARGPAPGYRVAPTSKYYSVPVLFMSQYY